jgi:hypothetical protein
MLFQAAKLASGYALNILWRFQLKYAGKRHAYLSIAGCLANGRSSGFLGHQAGSSIKSSALTRVPFQEPKRLNRRKQNEKNDSFL